MTVRFPLTGTTLATIGQGEEDRAKLPHFGKHSK